MKQFTCIAFEPADYFSGYILPCFGIPVFCEMTNTEVVKALKTELNSCFDMFEDIWDKEHDGLFNKYCEDLLQEPDLIFVSPNYEGDIPEDVEPSLLYFSFCDPVTIGGINFLNP